MTVNEWAKDFRSFVNKLQMPRDDYKGIMEYIDDAIALLKEQDGIVRCKDCVHWVPGYITDTDDFIPSRCLMGSFVGHSADDYCSYGKRN